MINILPWPWSWSPSWPWSAPRLGSPTTTPWLGLCFRTWFGRCSPIALLRRLGSAAASRTTFWSFLRSLSGPAPGSTDRLALAPTPGSTFALALAATPTLALGRVVGLDLSLLCFVQIFFPDHIIRGLAWTIFIKHSKDAQDLGTSKGCGSVFIFCGSGSSCSSQCGSGSSSIKNADPDPA